jgi:hypothetical protein
MNNSLTDTVTVEGDILKTSITKTFIPIIINCPIEELKSKNFISIYFPLDDFSIDMPDGGLRKGLNV